MSLVNFSFINEFFLPISPSAFFNSVLIRLFIYFYFCPKMLCPVFKEAVVYHSDSCISGVGFPVLSGV